MSSSECDSCPEIDGLVLSCTSSEFEESDNLTETILPYQFEPEEEKDGEEAADSDHESGDTHADVNNDRLNGDHW